MLRHHQSIRSCALLVATAIALSAPFARAEPAATTQVVKADRFHYAGTIVDEAGKPLAGVTVTATHRTRGEKGYGFIDKVTTDAAGRFVIDRADALSGARRADFTEAEIVWIEATESAHLPSRREDLATLAPDTLQSLRLEMKAGREQAGRVLDRAGKPVAGALVRAAFGENWSAGKGAITDADGRFTLRGLLPQDADLTVFAEAADGAILAHHAKWKPEAAAEAITLRAEPIDIPAGDVRTCLGMMLVTLDAKLADALGRPGQRGVLVLDPGERVERLAIGDVQPGDVFWYVGEEEVKTADAFRAALLAESVKNPAANGVTPFRVVYRFRRVDFDGTNTQHIRLSPADVASLNGPAAQ